METILREGHPKAGARQRRVTKLVDGLHQKSYSERLVILGLTTFRTRIRGRMLRADLIEVFKIFKGMDNL